MKPKITNIKRTSKAIEATIVADAEAIKKLVAKYNLTHSAPPAPFRFK